MKWMTKTSIILALVCFVVTGIASGRPNAAIAAQEASKSSTNNLAAIKSINVLGEGGASELVIALSSPVTYTSYKTTAPLRLVLDLSQASQGGFTSPQIINKGNFKTVTANRFDTDAGILTRIDIELNTDAEAIISAPQSNPGELHVSFPSLVTKTVAASQNAQNLNKLAEPVYVTQEPIVTQPVVSSASGQTAGSINKLSSISVIGDKIVLTVSGGVAEFNTFRLNKPERFVIDLMNTQLDMSSRLIPLNTAGVASARLGLYPDKIRVVLDSVNGIFPEVSVAKTDQGLAVTLISNSNVKVLATQTEKNQKIPVSQIEQPSKSVPNTTLTPAVVKAPAPIVPKASGYEPASVETIDFQVVENISRVAVKVKGDVSVDPPVKSPGYVTLTVKNAGLSKQLQRSFETQSFISPVLRITPLLVKTRKGTDTKIRIAMRAAADYEFRHEGDMLFVDFNNLEGLTSAKVQSEIQDSKAIKTKQESKPVNEDSNITSEIANSSNSKNTTDTIKVYSGRKISLEFADADVRKIFQLLSEVSGKNFVLGDEVTGTISLKLVNIPWTQALDIIVETKGFEYREENNVVMIRGAGKLKSQLDSAAEKRVAQLKSGRMITKNFAINYSNSDDVALALKPLLKYEWQGSLTSDKRTNTVIVNAVEQLMDDIEKLVKVIDVPESQVLIEARIIEASSTFTSNIGVNWGIHYRDGSASFMGINQLDTSFGGLASTAAPTSGVSGNSGGAMGISFGTLTSNVSLDLRLNAAASAGLIRIMSNPKVATLNNKTAKITQGQQVPYTSSTSDKVETKFIEAALSLEVTPHINSNGTISLKIDAKNDSVGQATGGSTAPAINKKQATTEMLLRDGETTVIGGIFVDSDNESEDGVPYLMNIPFLGKLFKSDSKTKVKTELLIFITPRILKSI